MGDQGVGASVKRKEDDRFLRGRGQYVGDIRLAGMKDVAFVRSPLAHAKLLAVHIPEEHRGKAFAAADLVGVKPIVAVSSLPGFKASEQPVLADQKVRQVGELIAMCVGRTRAEAEDVAASIEVDLEELLAVHDMLAARLPNAPLLHEHWGDNTFLETFVDINIEGAFDAPIKITREISTARQCMAPMEGARHGRLLGQPHGPTRLAHGQPDAAYRAHGPRGMPGADANPGADRLAGRRWRLSDTKVFFFRRMSASAGWRCAAAIHCVGLRTDANI